jgi:hypothetical protein
VPKQKTLKNAWHLKKSVYILIGLLSLKHINSIYKKC